MFEAHPDSGCSASLTDKCGRLINERACDEIFGQANGHVARATSIGDMPVVARARLPGSPKTTMVRFTLTNVRCVPAFKYTLLSVTQLWEENRVDARFRDLNHLEFPSSAGGYTVPYDSSKRLSTIQLVSERQLNGAHSRHRTGFDGSRQCAPVVHVKPNQAFLGFHLPKATSHIQKLSVAQAGQLMHRRTHNAAFCSCRRTLAGS